MGSLRYAVLASCFGVAACTSSINCGGCIPGGLAPIPGGLPAAAKIDQSAEIRMTQAGLDFIGHSFPDLVGAYAKMACGPGEPVACPTGFVVGGQPRSTTCLSNACVDPTTGKTEPVLGFQIDRQVSSGATVCRDLPSDPNPRDCFAWLRLEGLSLHPMAPNQLLATVTAQIYTNTIPFRYDALGMDCIVTLNSNASGGGTQDFDITADIGEWTPPGGGDGRQLKVSISNVTGMIADGDLSISRDPVHGDIADILTCGIANIGVVKNALVGRLVGSLGDIIDAQIQKVLGRRCGSPMDLPCPAATHCNSDLLCEEDQSGDIVPQRLGLEGRMDFSRLLQGFGSGSAGSGDLSFLVGGTSAADPAGATIGVLGGMESGVPDDRCSQPTLSPRLRPGYTAPPAFPTASTVDLDFDGTPEHGFMLGAGVSQQLLDQVIWSVYRSGVLCASVSSDSVKLINTGSLAVLMPSLAQLTHADKFAWSVWPARIAIRPGGEPTLTIGEGKTQGVPPNVTLTSPLLTLHLPGLMLDFSGLVEERWVRLMTVQADVDIPIGMYAGPMGDVQIVIGDLGQAITNIHVTNNEILAEPASELEMSVPGLLSLVLPQLTNALAQPLMLPSGRDLGGFTPTVLGVRGVPKAGGGYSHLGVYLDLAFDPSLAPMLSVQAETLASVRRFEVPSSEEMSIKHPGGPKLPHLELALDGRGKADATLEYQIAVDGGTWSPFVLGPTLVLERPEMLAQGRHQVLVRARMTDDPRSLDPTPSVIDLLVDTEPPMLTAELLASRRGALVTVGDVVSGDQVVLRVLIDGAARMVERDSEGVVQIPELMDADRRVEITATDEAGLKSSVLLQRGAPATVAQVTTTPAAQAGGCSCVVGRSSLGSAALGIAALFLVLRRRRLS